MSTPALRRPRRRAARRAAAGALGAVLVWLLVCWAVLQHPRVDAPAPSDALLVLGPPDDLRMQEAFRLMDAGLAPVLVVANPEPAPGDPSAAVHYAQALEACGADPGYEVICFPPDPSTTQGEAIELRELSAARGWDHVSALTFRQHVPRARTILARCYAGRLDMLSFDYPFGPLGVLHQFLYQSGGFVKAVLTPGCDQQLPGRPKSLD